jgi:hypothetical protein
MSDRLVQKHLIRGTQEFEIRDDLLRLTSRGLLGGSKTLDFVLASLNPDPVLNGDRLEFYGRVKCGPMLSLDVNKPDRESFDAFVERLKSKIRAEYGEFTGGKDAPSID